MKNVLINILKVAGALLFFWIFKYVLAFLFGRWVENLIAYYWLFVGFGLIPAFIARAKGYPFFLGWILGTWAPIISTVLVLGLDDQTCSSSPAHERPDEKELNP